MKKIFAAAAIALFMMTSCSDDDSSSPSQNGNNGNTDVVLLKKMIITDEDGNSIIYESTHSGNKLTKRTQSNNERVNYYTYAGNEHSGIEVKDGSELLLKLEYAYNDQGKLSTITKFNYVNGLVVFRADYTHNSDGTISTKTYRGDSESQTDFLSDGILKFINGNIYESVDGFITHQYSYDTKNSPSKNTFARDILNISDDHGGPNNIVQGTGDDMDGYTYTYTYNEDNYPVSATFTSAGKTSTIEYIYE